MRNDMAERLAHLACKAIYDTSSVPGVGVSPPDAKTTVTKERAYLSVLRAFQYYGRRRVVPKKIRLRVFKRDGFICKYCNVKFPVGALHLDHIIPLVEGGHDCMENFATACFTCNFKKGAKKLDPSGRFGKP